MFVHRDPRQAAASHARPLRSTRRAHRRFLVVLFVSGLVLVGLPYLPILSDSTYCRHSRLFWNATDCVKYALRNQNADILMVGDSALVFGIRPDVIERQTGFSAYNLGQPAGAVLFHPDMLLDHYLKSNRKPRLIVLFASPWTYLKQQPDLPHLWNDAVRVTLRHGTIDQVLSLFATDPRWLIQFPALIVQQEEWRHVDLSLRTWHAMNDEIEAGRGWLAYRNLSRTGQPVAALPERPSLASKPVGLPDRDKIETFRKKYERMGIKVAFYIASVPMSDPSYAQIRRRYAGLADNLPRRLPDRFFVDDGWRIHLLAAGTEAASLQMSGFLETFLGHATPPGGHAADRSRHP